MVYICKNLIKLLLKKTIEKIYKLLLINFCIENVCKKKKSKSHLSTRNFIAYFQTF